MDLIDIENRSNIHFEQKKPIVVSGEPLYIYFNGQKSNLLSRVRNVGMCLASPTDGVGTDNAATEANSYTGCSRSKSSSSRSSRSNSRRNSSNIRSVVEV